MLVSRFLVNLREVNNIEPMSHAHFSRSSAPGLRIADVRGFAVRSEPSDDERMVLDEFIDVPTMDHVHESAIGCVGDIDEVRRFIALEKADLCSRRLSP